MATRILLLLGLALNPVMAAEESAGEALPFYQTQVWQSTMEWVNLAILLFLVGRYILFPILKMLDGNIVDIETRLSREEQEKRAMEDRLAKARQALDGVDYEGREMIERAKKDADEFKEQFAAETQAKVEQVQLRLEIDKKAVEAEASEALKRKLYEAVQDGVLNSLQGLDSSRQGQYNEAMLKSMEAPNAG